MTLRAGSGAMTWVLVILAVSPPRTRPVAFRVRRAVITLAAAALAWALAHVLQGAPSLRAARPPWRVGQADWATPTATSGRAGRPSGNTDGSVADGFARRGHYQMRRG